MVAALLAIGAAVAVGGRAWDQFTTSDLQVAQPEERITDLGSGGRDEFWRVAVDAFAEEPIGGHGAGTYQFSWNQLREIPTISTQAHSLYLQAFAELGLIGGLLVLALVGFDARGPVSAPGAPPAAPSKSSTRCCWRSPWRSRSASRSTGSGRSPGSGSSSSWSAACSSPPAARSSWRAAARAPTDRASERRFGLAVAGLALAWITALALVGPLLVDREINASRAAAADGEFEVAVDHANTARSIEPWAASPYLATRAAGAGAGRLRTAAIERIGEAIDREDHNWILYYLRARLEHEAGEDAAAQADLAEAKRLNPLEACLAEGFEGCG